MSEALGKGLDRNWEEITASKEYGNMIFVSSPDRGLENILYCLTFAKERIPELKLHIFYGTHNWLSMAKSRNDQAQLQRIERLHEIIEKNKDWAIYHDRVNQQDLAKEWLKSYAWGYLDSFQETFCLSAKEAQCSATPSVTSNVGALESTVGEYGKQITHHPYSREGRVEFVEEIIKLHKDKDYWIQRSKQAFEGSQGISWGDRYNDYWRKWIEN
jgi:glycosyltransferase involved in cell wall biosynthesis